MNWKQNSFLLSVFSLQAIEVITLIFNIPFARQVSVFLFLMFIPGMLLLKIIKLEEVHLIETILFSVGLSLSFLMLTGYLMNQLGSFGIISKPLSTEYLTIAINIVVVALCVVDYFKNRNGVFSFETDALRTLSESMFYLVLPILSVIGVFMVVSFSDNVFLMAVMIIIAIVFVSVSFSQKSSSHYPLIVFSIALALLLSITLATKYVYGSDIALEYNVFRQTQSFSSLDWQPIYFGQLSYKSMMSVTILPTIFSNLLNIDGDLIFKVVFSIVFAFVPLGLYQLYQPHWGKKVAFISSIFFVSNYMFYSLMTTVAKQMIAELFFVLLFLLILRETKSDTRSEWIVAIFLIFGLVVSHYSMSYIFIFLILLAFILGKVFIKDKHLKLTSPIVAFSLCFAFFWYTSAVQGPFENLVNMIRSTANNFIAEFFYAGSRGAPIELAIGLVGSETPIHSIGRLVHNLTSLLILIGFIFLLVKWKKRKIDPEFALLTSLSMGLLIATIVVPRLASFLEMGRWYQISLLLVAPLFVLGAEAIFVKVPQFFINAISHKKEKEKSNIINKSYGLILTSIVLVAFFLFQTGFIYEITGDPVPSSIALSRNKMGSSNDLIYESDVFSAYWLSNYADINNTITYADTVSIIHVLTSYSTIDRSIIQIMSNTTEPGLYPEQYFSIKQPENPNLSYVYLRYYNVYNGKVVYNTKTDTQFKVSELPIFNDTAVFVNKIYSNSYSEIFYRTP